MSENFLLSEFLSRFPSGPVTAGQISGFIKEISAVPGNFHNFDRANGQPIFAHKATVLYSGNIGAYTGNIASDLGDRSSNQIRVLDNTKAGQFLDAVANKGALGARLDLNDLSIKTALNKGWDAVSEKFVDEGRGKLIAIAGKDASVNGVLASKELPKALAGANYTELNGIKIDDVKKALGGIPSVEAKKAYGLALAENSFAKNVQDAGLKVYEGPLTDGRATKAAINWDSGTLSKLGVDVQLGPLDLDNAGLQEKLGASALKSELQYLRAKGANIQGIALKYGDSARDWANTFSEDNVTQKQRNQWTAEQIDRLKAGTILPEETGEKIHIESNKQVPTPDAAKTSGRWVNSVLKEFGDYLDNLPNQLTQAGKNVWKYYQAAWDDTLGLLKPNGQPFQYALKLTGTAVGVLLGALDGVAEYKKAGGFTAEFWKWAAFTTAVAAVAIPVVGAGASAAIAASPLWGTAAVYTFVAGGLYLGVRSVATNLVEAYKNEPDSYFYIAAKAVLDGLQGFEKQAWSYLVAISESFVSSAQAADVKAGIDTLEVENFQVVGESGAGYTFENENTWLYGEDKGALLGGKENNWLFHSGYGEVYGQDGEDILIGLFPTELKAGEKIGEAPPAGEEDIREISDSDLNLILDGGDGNDWVISVLGEKAVTIGGAGRDWIFNTSKEGVIFGDTIDGLDPETGGKVTDSKENSDNFWFWPGVTIKDAGHYDVLKFFGLPLTGGNIAAGGSFAVAMTSIGGYTGGGLAWAGFATTIAANANYEGKKPGWTGGLFWDNLVPFI
ncbi:MAG: hypothetical protein ABL908_11110, partial [Hyphomicrobium sp.]